MKNAIEKFNGLNGAEVSIKELQELYNQAKAENCPEVANRLRKVLKDNNVSGNVVVKLKKKIEPKKQPPVIKMTPKTPAKTIAKQTAMDFGKSASSEKSYDAFKGDLQLLMDYSKTFIDGDVIPFKSATILWTEAASGYDNKIAYSFSELQGYLIEMFKASDLYDNPYSGYDKCKLVFEWQQDMELTTRLDIAVNDFNPTVTKVEDMVRESFLRIFFDKATANFEGYFIDVMSGDKDTMKIPLLQYGDDNKEFQPEHFMNEALVYLMQKEGVPYPRILVFASASPEDHEKIEQEAKIVKDYAKEIGRDEAVLHFYRTAEYNGRILNSIGAMHKFRDLPMVSDIPVEIEPKNFDITATTTKFKDADTRKTTSLIKKYLKEVFRIKTSVKSSYFSMGSSMDVSYSMGPAPKLVEAVIDRLQYGTFNGMDDSYNYKSKGSSGIYLDGYKLNEYKYTGVGREIPLEFRIKVAQAISKGYNHRDIPKLEDLPGDSIKVKLTSYFPDHPKVRTYSDFVYRVLVHLSFETQDPSQITDIVLHTDGDIYDLYEGMYLTYKIGKKQYDSREYKEGKTKMDTPPKAVTHNIQILNLDKKRFIVVGYLGPIKKALEGLGGEYKKTVKVKDFGNLEGVILHKSKLSEATDIVIDFSSSGGLGNPALRKDITGAAHSLLTRLGIVMRGSGLSGLNAAQHKGARVNALDECGRLRPGYYFLKGGQVARVKDKKTPPKKKVPTKQVEKKEAEITSKKSATATVANKKSEPKKGKARKKFPLIVSYPIDQINIDEKRFQNRSKLNEATVKNIVENFNETQFDPVVIWTDPKDGKVYLLAGHHRLEAYRRLNRDNVPAKFADKDYPTEKEAIKYARQLSNANRTLETSFERAKIYREMANNGETQKAIEKAAAIEGKNKNYILNLAALNDNGRVISALERLADTPDKQNEKALEKIADWTGEARRKYPALTDAHETEIFKFLNDAAASKRIRTKADFLQKIYSIAGGIDFDPDNALNLKRIKYKSEGEKTYDEDLAEMKNNISDKQDTINTIKARFTDTDRTDYVKPDAKDYDGMKKLADEKISQLNTEIKRIQKRMLDHQRNKGKYTRAGQNQGALFGPTATTAKKDGKQHSGESCPSGRGSVNDKLGNFADQTEMAPAFPISGEAKKLFQQVEKKPVHSVVVTLDGEKGCGKTTTLYRFMQDFTDAGNSCLFASLEEHPGSNLAKTKADKYLSASAVAKIATIGEFENYGEFCDIVQHFDVVVIDSWQKLKKMVGNIAMDEDIRKRFDGKLFVIVFQQTTTGTTKGGAQIGFDGDVILKGVKQPSFSENYFYLEKHRYTEIPIEDIRYMIAEGKTVIAGDDKKGISKTETPSAARETSNVIWKVG